MAETLTWLPAIDHPELLSPPTARAVAALGPDAGVEVAAIDPASADTEPFCARYGLPLETSANCVVVSGKRAGVVKYAACLVLATTRADINNVVRRHLDVRKVSFAPLEEVVALTRMEYGGVTPLGLPAEWPALVDEAVVFSPEPLVIGSGLRASKLLISGKLLAALSTATILPHLAAPR